MSDVDHTLQDEDEIKDLTGKVTLANLPWWLYALILIFIYTGWLVYDREHLNEAFNFIIKGIWFTVFTSIISYVIAIILGLFAGLGRMSRNVVMKNVATFYVEFIRGIPMLVLIFFIALVGVPTAIDYLNPILAKMPWLISLIDRWVFFVASVVEWFFNIVVWVDGNWFEMEAAVKWFSKRSYQPFVELNNKSITTYARAIIALSVTYGAFLAEVFRAGIQSIGRGQMEAARSQGMSHGQAMRYVILPQAIRNVLPALGNDFVAMVKDSSLVSLLAVGDITYRAKLYTGASFRFKEGYTILSIVYLMMTVVLSGILRQFEKRLQND